ncbi:MAG: type I-B CRISPR-associated protein Cas7/Cst2/DevR [candidate division WOR-3 bacterium]
MSKVVQISIVGKVHGNVNADEVIGTRITLKKMYSSAGEVLPFVSARAIKFAIRKALREKGLPVDPLRVNPEATETLRLSDSARPNEFIDNDIFGYMRTLGEKGALKRQAPIALSYFKALKDTPIKAEFAARFPRSWGEEESPAPFEIEVAEFIGKINCIMYDYIGNFTLDRKVAKSIKNNEEAKKFLEEVPESITNEERKERIKAFCEVFLTPLYVLSRATNSLNIPEYIAGLVVLSEKGPLPVFQYLDYDFEKNELDIESLKRMVERNEIRENMKKIFLIDYKGKINEIPSGIVKVTSVNQVISEIVEFL